jgi:hypothetical protein
VGSLIPFEGGVLEFGTATDGSTADWGGMPPPLPQIPSKQLHRAYEALGAGYAVLWQLRGDKMRVVAGHTSAARMLVRSDAHDDSTSFESKSRGLELDANGSGPVATALRSGREVFVGDVPNSSMKRAALAREYGIKSIFFTPMEGLQYVLECGVPDTARLAGSILEASLTLRCDVSGAAYAMYWVEVPKQRYSSHQPDSTMHAYAWCGAPTHTSSTCACLLRGAGERLLRCRGQPHHQGS